LAVGALPKNNALQRAGQRLEALVLTVTVAGLKGGVAKTTSAVNVAAGLAASGYRVRLLDLDPQASATLSLGLAPVADPFASVAAFVDGVTGALELLPGGRALAALDDAQASALVARASTGAEVLVIDTPPALSALTRAALRAATVVLAPLEPTPLAIPSLRDLQALLGALEAPPALWALLVRVQARRTLTADVEALLAAEFPGALVGSIPEDVRAAEAPGYGLPLLAYARGSRAAEAYSDLVALLRTRLMPQGGAR
jgi:chromosome partitioning protein